ncbi:hypothetical protein M422DRAFT_239125 [Sphaerobolus stellatus SS14]|nr:hypothetical protein M422DRAFT_239125 [Sphaerobolus stellatus SS14]
MSWECHNSMVNIEFTTPLPTTFPQASPQHGAQSTTLGNATEKVSDLADLIDSNGPSTPEEGTSMEIQMPSSPAPPPLPTSQLAAIPAPELKIMPPFLLPASSETSLTPPSPPYPVQSKVFLP